MRRQIPKWSELKPVLGVAAPRLTSASRSLRRSRRAYQSIELRSAGIYWNKIGEILGTSAQAAQQRCGAVVEQT